MLYDHRHHRTDLGHRLASHTLLMLSLALTYTAGPWLIFLDHLQAPHAAHHAAPSWLQMLQAWLQIN